MLIRNIPGLNVTLTFPNGYELSIGFGPGNYGNGSARILRGSVYVKGTVETAIFAPNGDIVPYKGDDVQGWQTADDVQATTEYVKSL